MEAQNDSPTDPHGIPDFIRLSDRMSRLPSYLFAQINATKARKRKEAAEKATPAQENTSTASSTPATPPADKADSAKGDEVSERQEAVSDS